MDDELMPAEERLSEVERHIRARIAMVEERMQQVRGLSDEDIAAMTLDELGEAWGLLGEVKAWTQIAQLVGRST
jgi:hypothetical protein